MMRHFDEIIIQQFRGLRDLKLEGLGQINLLVGNNNSGKTSVLESIEVLCQQGDMANLVKTSFKRGVSSSRVDNLLWLFPVLKTNEVNNIGLFGLQGGTCFMVSVLGMERQYLAETIRNSLTNSDAQKNETDELVRGVYVETKLFSNKAGEKDIELLTHEARIITDLPDLIPVTKSSDALPVHFISNRDYRSLMPSTKSISEIIAAGDRMDLVALLRYFDEEIDGIELLDSHGSGAVPNIKHRKKGYVPLALFGDGLLRVFTLACSVVLCKDGVLLIDELEIAVHSGVLEKVFAWLVKACKEYKVQLFATTHSLEAVDAVLAAFLESDEVKADPDNWEQHLQDLVTYRLVPREDHLIVKRFAGNLLADIRYELGQDVR